RLHKESHQVLELTRIFDPVTKYSASVLEPDIVPEVVRKAFKVAQTEKTGATFIEFPENIAAEQVAAEPLPVSCSADPETTNETIELAAAVISNARHPMILAGNGVVRARAWTQLAEFADRLNIPVANTFMAKGVIPFGHRCALGSAGLQANDYISCGFNSADVIICIGYDLVEYHPYLWHPGRDRTIVHIDHSPPEVDAYYPVAVGVKGDIRHSLQRIAACATPHQGQHMRPLRERLIEEMSQHRDDMEFPVKPQKVIWDLRTALGLDDIVVCDVGAHKMWMARMFRCEHPNTCIISNGFAGMGIAVPGAIAARLVHPDRKVVAVTGDAGFMMNSQEIETAVRCRTPVVILIWNDSSYGLIEWKQMVQFGRPSHVRFGNPDFVQYAKSFGAQGYRVERTAELPAILDEALASDTVSIIDCPVDYRENIKLTEQMGTLVCPT
ncbi:MAG TPA: acetolactate synthase large subunit, partial [Gammaproteobacteria bacterium]|nr:acetolactate synthase large subunit [Gammaproteobacteria bacterium]